MYVLWAQTHHRSKSLRLVSFRTCNTRVTSYGTPAEQRMTKGIGSIIGQPLTYDLFVLRQEFSWADYGVSIYTSHIYRRVCCCVRAALLRSLGNHSPFAVLGAFPCLLMGTCFFGRGGLTTHYYHSLVTHPINYYGGPWANRSIFSTSLNLGKSKLATTYRVIDITRSMFLRIAVVCGVFFFSWDLFCSGVHVINVLTLY